MVKKVEGYECEECGKKFTTRQAAKECEHDKKAKTYGDPVVELM